uniref:Uncharacterized protein n=1 Tax=Acrobeloides nanus TaxID=290746 RepID=A0A914D417_9BILA
MFEPDRPNGLIYHGELIFDDHYEKFYALKLIRKDVGAELNFDRAVVLSIEYPNKWILLGNEARIAILNEGEKQKIIFPTEDTYESSFYYRFSENAKQMGRFTSHLFFDGDKLCLLHSSLCNYGWQCLYKHILYEVEIDEIGCTYK